MRRRRFLGIIGMGAFFSLIGKFLWVKGATGDKKLTIKINEIPEGGALLLPDDHLAVLRMNEEVAALDLTCTHLGCIVRATPQGFLCPCHGSAFSYDGSVIKGPAPRGLLRLPLKRSGKTVVVFLSRKGMNS
jgi:Rieske Fe-S protein